jgi:hypothetical protein
MNVVQKGSFLILLPFQAISIFNILIGQTFSDNANVSMTFTQDE